MHIRRLIAVAALSLATAAPAWPAPVAYTLDPTAGAVYVQVFKDPTTLASGLSHDHVVRATGWTGSVTWDAADPGACRVNITVPVKQLQADAPEMRRKVGYTNTLDDGQRADVTEHMLGPDQLDAAKHPNITFSATKCESNGSGANVTGNFTMHGVTRTITVPFTLRADGEKLTAKGTFKLNQTDFGFSPYSALLGQLKNKDEVAFTIDVVGAKG